MLLRSNASLGTLIGGLIVFQSAVRMLLRSNGPGSKTHLVKAKKFQSAVRMLLRSNDIDAELVKEWEEVSIRRADAAAFER